MEGMTAVILKNEIGNFYSAELVLLTIYLWKVGSSSSQFVLKICVSQSTSLLHCLYVYLLFYKRAGFVFGLAEGVGVESRWIETCDGFLS